MGRFAWVWVLVFWMGCAKEPLRPIFDSHIPFPIVTHYPELNGTQADRRRKDPPGWGNYSAALTDPVAPSQDRVMHAVRRWEERGGCPVDVYNRLDSLKSGVVRMQVVNNVAIGNMLWTFFVGSNWRREGGPYLLVISIAGDGMSNNGFVYDGPDVLRLIDLVAESSAYPFVLAVVNAGGLESPGNHPDVLNAVADGIAFAKAHFSTDDQRVVFAGLSRGGTAALMWGANPLGLHYQTAAVFACAAVTDFTKTRDISIFPLPGSMGSEARIRLLQDCMAGSHHPDTLRIRSPIAHMERLRHVYLVVGFGTHDPVAGPEQAFDFCQAMDRSEMAYFAEFVLGGGREQFAGVQRALELFVRKEVQGEKGIVLPLGRRWTHPGGEAVEGGSPVWSVFPERATVHGNYAVYAGGPDGSEVYVLAEAADGDGVWTEFFGRIAWDYVRVDLPRPPKPGRYWWTITMGSAVIPDDAIVKRGLDGSPLPPETRVLADDAAVAQDAQAFGQAWVWPY